MLSGGVGDLTEVVPHPFILRKDNYATKINETGIVWKYTR